MPRSADRGSAARATLQRAAPSSDLDAPGRNEGRTVKERTTETCTTVIVGKGLTEKGNLLHAHNEDLWFDTAQNLLSEPARTVDPASDVRFYHVAPSARRGR
ncbi:hypothetical protein WMF38_00620 [Sorangium sp. So ce118]